MLLDITTNAPFSFSKNVAIITLRKTYLKGYEDFLAQFQLCYLTVSNQFGKT